MKINVQIFQENSAFCLLFCYTGQHFREYQGQTPILKVAPLRISLLLKAGIFFNNKVKESRQSSLDSVRPGKSSIFSFEPGSLNSDCFKTHILKYNSIGVPHSQIHILNLLGVRFREILLY